MDAPWHAFRPPTSAGWGTRDKDALVFWDADLDALHRSLRQSHEEVHTHRRAISPDLAPPGRRPPDGSG